MFSFNKRKQFCDLTRYTRRLCDLTTSDMITPTEGRSENRYNRTIPTLLCPWDNGQPQLDDSIMGITNNIADHGIGLVVNQEFQAGEVIVSYWISAEIMSEPWFFLGNIRRSQPIGGGFWAVGIELTEFANTNRSNSLFDLRQMVEQLLSPIEVLSE